MTNETLKYINTTLKTNHINYAFQTLKTTGVTYPYWIGEFTEGSPDEQTGYRKSTFILTGTTNGTWNQLQTEKNLIETLFRDKKVIHDNGHAVAFFMEDSFEIPTQLDTYKRIQLNITIMEWRN